jgi:hypothetical protein
MGIRKASEVYNGSELFAPAGNGLPMTASNDASTDATRPITVGVWVGGIGDLPVVFAGGDGNVVVIPAVPQGTYLPMRIVRVAATGLTASAIIGFYGVQ